MTKQSSGGIVVSSMVSFGNRLYPNGRKNVLQGFFDVGGTSKIALVSNGYDPQGSDEFYNTAIGAPGYEVASAILTGQSIIGDTPFTVCTGCAAFIANDITFTGIAPDLLVDKIVIYKNGTSGVDDYVLAYIESGSAGNPINIVTDGNDITINWNMIELSGFKTVFSI